MSNQTKNLSLPQTALVSFILQRLFIEEKLSEGHTKTAIWKVLSDAKLIEMSYNHFRRLCNSQLGHRKRRSESAGSEKRATAIDDIHLSQNARPVTQGPVANRPREKKKFEADLNMLDREFT
jgi:hypothetical protein